MEHHVDSIGVRVAHRVANRLLPDAQQLLFHLRCAPPASAGHSDLDGDRLAGVRVGGELLERLG